MEDLYRVKQVEKVPHFMIHFNTEIETLVSDCVIKKDVTTMPLLIYFDELYMLHPLISALILET